MDKVLTLLEGMDAWSLIVLMGGILALVHILPNTIKKLGISRLGPLEIEHQHQSQNYEINRKIENIDIDNRENLWEMTEDLFAVAAESSPLGCDAAIGYILAGVSSPIRTMVLLNHIAPKLVKSEEATLRAKINRGISRAVKEAKYITQGDGCPISEDISDLSVSRYDTLIQDWILRARSIASRACLAKIKVYEDAVDTIHDKYWKAVYKTCIQKNKEYIKGMGYDI